MILLAGCDEKSLKWGKAKLPSSNQQKCVNFHPFFLKHCISVITINVEEAVLNKKPNISGSSPNRDPSKNITVTKSQSRVTVPLKVTVQPNLEGIVSRLISFPCFNKSSAVPTKTEAMLSRSNSRPKCRIAIQLHREKVPIGIVSQDQIWEKMIFMDKTYCKLSPQPDKIFNNFWSTFLCLKCLKYRP
jgi:hypothetical protein